MAAQPQPPQQPIYPNEFRFALDKLYAQITIYVDARIEALATQMRVNNQESIRDEESKHRDQDLANLVIAFREESRKQIETFREESRKQIETLREESRKQTETLFQHINALHGEAMEGINELRTAVNKLQQKDNE